MCWKQRGLRVVGASVEYAPLPGVAPDSRKSGLGMVRVSECANSIQEEQTTKEIGLEEVQCDLG